MTAAEIAMLANAALDLAAKLVFQYMQHPDASESAVAEMNAKLDTTVALVKSKQPIPPPTA